MAAAQNLKVTHAVAETVVAIDNKVDEVDDRVANANEQLTSIDDRVAGVSDQVAGVDDRVAGVSDQVAGVDDRVQQMADQIKRMPFLNLSADLSNLTYPFREPTARERSQMAFPTRSFDDPQYCMWYSSQERSSLVFSRQHLSGLEIIRIPSLDPRKTFALYSLQLDSL
jgi:hypothetical protein